MPFALSLSLSLNLPRVLMAAIHQNALDAGEAYVSATGSDDSLFKVDRLAGLYAA